MKLSGEIVVRGTDIRLPLGKVANAVAGTPGYVLPGGVDPGMESTQRFLTDPLAYCYSAHCCELEVDIETGAVKFERYVIVHDSGNLMNPMVVRGKYRGRCARYRQCALRMDGL